MSVEFYGSQLAGIMAAMHGIIIRMARAADAGEIAGIYAPYVTDTAITFDEAAADAAAMSRKIRAILATHPFLVAQLGQRVVGYAYASEFRPRASFRWAVEVTVYVSREHHRRGIGRALYDVLLPMLSRQGFVSAYAVITLPGLASVALHEKFGFTRAGVLQAAGFKLGTWHDVGYWQRQLNEPTTNPREPAPPMDVNLVP